MSAFSDLPEETRQEPQHAPVLVMPAPKPSRGQIWMHRIGLVVFVLLCLELGTILMIGPWTRAWSENSLSMSFPELHEFLMNNFVRGVVSGLGVVDLWIGIARAISYRETV